MIYDLSEEIKLEKNKKHTIEIVVDRLVIQDGYSVLGLRILLKLHQDLQAD